MDLTSCIIKEPGIAPKVTRPFPSFEGGVCGQDFICTEGVGRK